MGTDNDTAEKKEKNKSSKADAKPNNDTTTSKPEPAPKIRSATTRRKSAGAWRMHRVIFGQTNRTKLHQASMKALKTEELQPTDLRTASNKSILCTK